MRALYIAGIATLSIWAIITTILLPIYAKTEVNENIYYNVTRNGATCNDNTGIPVVIFNTVHVFELIILIRWLTYAMQYGWDGPNVDQKFLKTINIFWMILFMVTFGTAFYGFLDVCADDKLPCFGYKTPLYILLLIKLLIIFAFFAGVILYIIGKGLYYICCPKDMNREAKKEEQARDQIPEPPVQITLDTLQQVRQHDLQTDCVICSEKFGSGKDIRILKCSHYFHTSCIEKWQLTANTCPVCKQVIVH
jgi:hypothetical protein